MPKVAASLACPSCGDADGLWRDYDITIWASVRMTVQADGTVVEELTGDDGRGEIRIADGFAAPSFGCASCGSQFHGRPENVLVPLQRCSHCGWEGADRSGHPGSCAWPAFPADVAAGQLQLQG